jgi:hypothetical protein
MSKWQPIETAPRDGTKVIVWPPTWTATTSVANWDEQKYHKKPRPYWDRKDAFSVIDCRARPPTHWQPILAGPDEEKA